MKNKIKFHNQKIKMNHKGLTNSRYPAPAVQRSVFSDYISNFQKRVGGMVSDLQLDMKCLSIRKMSKNNRWCLNKVMRS